jgi:exopolysaccharide biosynthesis WecB/TagA/CpsF family protein
MDLQYPLDDYNLDEFISVAAGFGQKEFGFVVTPNVDHLIRFHDDAEFRAAYGDATFILLDSRVLSGIFRLVKRLSAKVCTGSDLTEQLFQRVIMPADRIVLVGGSDAQMHALTAKFGLTGLSHFNPPMGFIKDPKAVEDCLRFVEANSPFRFCFLAVGAPQQEILARRLKQRGIARGIAFCIGASINFLTGDERRAPRWMQRIGLEWLFRLLGDPTRLAPRYLLRGPRILTLLGRTRVRLRPRGAFASVGLPNTFAPARAAAQRSPESV